MRPVCVPCRRFFRVKRNGIAFVEGMPIYNDAPPGNTAPDRWAPYKLWHGDLYECRGCGAQIISGFGRDPLAVRHESDFDRQVIAEGAEIQVNDC